MSAKNVIEFGFNLDQLNEEKKQVLDLFVDMFGKLKEYDGTKFNPLGNGGLADLKRSITEGAQALSAFNDTAKKYNDTITEQAKRQSTSKQTTSELSAAMKEYQRIVDQLSAAQAKNNAASSDAREGLALEQQALKQRNAELSASARLQLAEANSVNEAEAANAKLTLEKKNLNQATEEGKQRLVEINAEMNKNTEFIRASASAAEKQKMNIGNYAGSLAPAFQGLNELLEGVNEKIAAIETRGQSAAKDLTRVPIGFDNGRYGGNSNNVSGFAGGAGASAPILQQDAAAYEQLIVQQKILEGGLGRQKVGFSNVNQEMRNVKNTLDALSLTSAKDSEEFEKLNTVYTQSEQKIKDLHREQAILTGDAPAITALTGVAKGLGGAYAIGASAAGVFADGNEKVEKELNKLVAVMTFLQGLEEATAALKDRNAIATALEAEATKALNFIKAIEVRLFGEAKVAEVADTAAKEANVAATEANVAGTVANTTAIEAETAATEGATEATIGLRTALVGIGIGAVIIAVGVLIAKIIEWSEAENKAAAESAELAEALEKINEILLERIRLSDEDAQHTKQNLQDALTLAQANKQSYNDIYSIKKATADLDLQTAQNDLKKAANTNDLGEAYRIIDGNVKSLDDSLNPLLKKQTELVEIGKIWQQVQRGNINQGEAYLQIYQKFGNQLSAEDAKTQLESVTKAADAIKKTAKDQTDIRDNYNKAVIAGEAAVIDKQQHDAEELRQITLQTSLQQADAIKAKNQLILNDDRSTLEQRLAAIRSNTQQEKDILAANLNEQISRPGSRDSNGALTAASTIAIQKAAEERTKITEQSQQEQYKLIVQYNDARLSYLNSINKNELDADAAVQKAISDNDTKELDVRLTALYKNIGDRSQAISGDYALQLKLAIEHNKTQEEFDKIESDRQKALVELNANTEKEIYDTVVSWGEKRLKAIDEQNKIGNSTNSVSENYTRASDALDKGLSRNILSVLGYDQRRRKLDEQYAIDSANAQVKDDEKKLQDLKDYQEKDLDIKAAFANSQLELAKAGGDAGAIEKAQSEADGILKIQKETAAAITELTKKTDDDREAARKAADKKNVDAAANLKNDLTRLTEQAVSSSIEMYNNAHEKRIMNIERETELADRASETEIAAVQRSTLSSRQQAEEVTILQAQKTARDTAAAKQVRAEKIEEAKFERNEAIAQAIWNTAAGVAKTLEVYGFTPLGIAGAAALAALGAVQIATIESTPIPSYAEGVGIPGRGHHPGGEAVVGEAGPELVSIPGRKPFVVDQATLIDLAPDSKVQPLNKDIVADIGGASLMRSFAILNSAGQDHAIERAIDSQTTRLERAFKRSQRKIINHIHIPGDTLGLSRDYYETKVKGIRKK